MKARIVTVSQGRSLCRSVQGNRDFITAVLARVWPHTPDLICLPEAFSAKGVAIRSVADVAETLPGPTSELLSALARQHQCYIICPIYTQRDGQFYNSAVLIGRDGALIGCYDKIRPYISSTDGSVFEEGVTPGSTVGIFDLDFGRIAIRICLEASFPEDWHALAAAGVKVVCWPSAFAGGTLLQAHAVLHNYYVIAATRSGQARVINPCGQIIAETLAGESYALADINLDFVVARQDFQLSLPTQIRAQYGDRVAVHSYPAEGLFLIEPTDSSVTTAQLQAEFGFESAAQFISRHQEAYARWAQEVPPVLENLPHDYTTTAA